jgi:high-affinity Fe2+/Pb2+ permease
MKAVKLLAIAMAALIAVMGVIGMAAPATLLEFGRSLQTPAGLYAVAAIGVLFGAMLVWLASASRMPRTLRVIGVLVIMAGLLVPLLGIERTQSMLGWLSGQEPMFIRGWASGAVLFGVFIVYALGWPHRAGPR